MSCCLTGCTTPENTGDTSKKQTEQQEEIKKAETQDINDVHLRDKDRLYENDDETSVVTMYLTVSRGNSSEGTITPGRRSTVIRPMIMTRWE